MLADFQNSFTERFSIKFAVKQLIIKDPTTHHMHRYTTLWNINVRKQAVAAPEGRSRVGFSLCEAAERRRREERGAEGSRRRRRRDERRRREGRGAIGAEGGRVWEGVSILVHFAIKIWPLVPTISINFLLVNRSNFVQ